MREKNMGTPKKKKIRKSTLRSSCVSLIPLDTVKIRRKYMQQLEKLREKVARQDALLKHFETKVIPGYNNWIHLQLGPLQQNIRLLEDEIRYEEAIQCEAYNESIRRRISISQAYHNVVERIERQARGDLSPAPPEVDNEERDSRNERRDDFDPFTANEFDDVPEDGDMDAEFAKMLEQWLGIRMDPDVKKQASRKEQHRKEMARKKFRILSRLLHPDANRNFTEEQRELWYETQAAYSKLNLEWLDELITRVELTIVTPSRTPTIAGILKQFVFFNRALASLKVRLRAVKRSFLYDFLEWTEAQKESHLRPEKVRLETEIWHLRQQLEILKKKAHRFLHPEQYTRRHKSRPMDRNQLSFRF
jgi:hypothetical protein